MKGFLLHLFTYEVVSIARVDGLITGKGVTALKSNLSSLYSLATE